MDQSPLSASPIQENQDECESRSHSERLMAAIVARERMVLADVFRPIDRMRKGKVTACEFKKVGWQSNHQRIIGLLALAMYEIVHE
jgi:hypothetical protein